MGIRDGVKVHPISSGGTNDIYLNYGSISAKRKETTLELTFSKMQLESAFSGSGYFWFWLGIWPYLIFKDASGGAIGYYRPAVKKANITGDEVTFAAAEGGEFSRNTIKEAGSLFIKPYEAYNGNWTWAIGTGAAPNNGLTSLTINTDDKKNVTGYTLTIDLTNLCQGDGSITHKDDGTTTYPSTKEVDSAKLSKISKVTFKLDTWSFNAASPEGDAAWGGCECTDHSTDNVATITNDISFYTEITAGTISIVDNGNNTFTVSGNNGSGGINNALNSGTLNTVLNIEGVSFSLVDVDTNDTLAGTTDGDKFSRTYKISDPNDKIGEDGVITVTSTLTNVPSQSKDSNKYAEDEKEIKFYKAPKWNKNTANLTFTSGDSGQYNNRPRLKKPLKWAWTGATPGNTASHNVIRGYQIYICNGGGGIDKAVGLYPYRGKFTLNSGNTSPGAKVFETSTNDSAGAYAYVINRGTTNNTLVTDGSGNISFTPIDLGFASKNICYCRVRPFSYWGNRVATKELGSDGNKATYTQYAKNYGPWLIGICTADGSDTTATYIKGTQCVLSNGAVVWVRVDTNGDGTPDTWKEGTVYVYHNNKWKEAEGVYVRNGSKWKEST